MQVNQMIHELRDFKGDAEVPIVALAFYTKIQEEIRNDFSKGKKSYHRKLNLSVERLDLNLSKHEKRYSCNMRHLCNIATKLTEYLRNDGCVVNDDSIMRELQYIKMIDAAKKANAINTTAKSQTSAYNRQLVLDINAEE